MLTRAITDFDDDQVYILTLALSQEIRQIKNII